MFKRIVVFILLCAPLMCAPALGQVSGSPGVTGGLGPIGVETFGNKLRRLARNSLNNNPTVNTPLAPPPTWVINTAYAVGQVVTNGANEYICNVAGTSAGAGGPTGTAMTAITDNTATWYWFGISTPAAAAVTAPTITQSATTTLTNLYAYNASPSPFYFTGGPPTDSGTSYTFPCTHSVPPGTTVNCGWTVTFVTDAPKIAYKTNGSTNSVRFIVDGQYVSLSGYPNGSGANPSYDIIDFTTAGARKVRTITVEGHLNVSFKGIVVGATEEIWAPPTNDRVKVIFEGDSIVTGGAGFPSVSGLDMRTVCLLVGWSDCSAAGQGGTGYVVTNAQSNYGQRIAYDVTPYSPDIVVFEGSSNDGGQADATITANALADFQAVRAALPTAIILVFGVWPGSSGPSASHISIETDVAAAVTAFADARTYFIPISTDTTQDWITGTGKITAVTGTGNADNYVASDGVHPTDQGRIYLYYRMAKAIRSIVQQIP